MIKQPKHGIYNTPWQKIPGNRLRCALAFLGRYVLDRGRELCMSYGIHGPVLDFVARRVFAEEVVALPILRWSDGPGNKTTTAVRADVPQNVIDTRRAKRAFIGANARFQ